MRAIARRRTPARGCLGWTRILRSRHSTCLGAQPLPHDQTDARPARGRVVTAHNLKYRQCQCITPADVFQARAEARATLFAASELDLQTAVDALQHAAITSGLADELGQDWVQG